MKMVVMMMAMLVSCRCDALLTSGETTKKHIKTSLGVMACPHQGSLDNNPISTINYTLLTVTDWPETINHTLLNYKL